MKYILSINWVTLWLNWWLTWINVTRGGWKNWPKVRTWWTEAEKPRAETNIRERRLKLIRYGPISIGNIDVAGAGARAFSASFCVYHSLTFHLGFAVSRAQISIVKILFDKQYRLTRGFIKPKSHWWNYVRYVKTKIFEWRMIFRSIRQQIVEDGG